MNAKRILFLCALLAALLLSMALSCSIGSAGVLGPGALWRSLWLLGDRAPALESDTVLVLLQLRVPRVILGTLVGANLAVAGLLMQALFGNPLADPHIIGVSSGAALGAVAALALGVSSTLFGVNAVALCAFAGAIGTVLLVYALARRGTAVPVSVLLLTGVSLGALAQALTTLLLMRTEGGQLRSIFAWLLGSLAFRDMAYVEALLPYSVLGLGAALCIHRRLNLMAMGNEVAHHLGVRLETTKLLLIAIASLLAASSVAACGIIGFVGLVVPNLMRLMVGSNHRFLLPGCIVGGALLVIWSDLLSRSLVSGQEIPIGVVTSFVGGIFFLFLLRRARQEEQNG